MSCCCWFRVRQSNVAVVESMGKFNGVHPPGCHLFNCMTSSVKGSMSLKYQYSTTDVNAPTADNANVALRIGILYRVNPSLVYQAFYRLSSSSHQIGTFVTSTLRGIVPTKTLDDLFVSQNEMAGQIKTILCNQMMDFGYEIVEVLIISIGVTGPIRQAMNRQMQQRYDRQVTELKSDIEKIRRITQAEAAAEADRLEGVGLAECQKAVTGAFREGMKGFRQEHNPSESEIMATMLMMQYFDMIHDVTERGAVKAAVVYMPERCRQDGLPQLKERLSSIMAKKKVVVNDKDI